MSYCIGFAGKGGTGKSTIASIVIRYLSKKNGPVLAIDADPNTSLQDMLGLKIEDTIVSIIDDVSSNIDKLPQGVTKERLIENRVQQSLGEGENVDLLVMGRPEGPGCYCYPNTLLREIIGKLEKAYKFIVIDNEAGLEHLSRRTDRRIDYFFIISDPTQYGLRSARRILELASELRIARGINHLIINRVKEDISSLKNLIEDVRVDKVDLLRESQELIELNISTRPLSELREDARLVKSIYKICEGAKWL